MLGTDDVLRWLALAIQARSFADLMDDRDSKSAMLVIAARCEAEAGYDDFIAKAARLFAPNC
jgi:hypothetical protein